ncbi:MAG: hypothetical protein JW954_05575 [Dehalococcoidaceae bacterium]|nr:hypothetical protein [Dehalococcoidaceae bacterium]
MRYDTLFISVLLILLTFFFCGCSPVNPVQKIMIFPRPAENVIPTSGWVLFTNPFPTGIMHVFQPEEEMLVGIKVSGEIDTSVTFDKITFSNQNTLEEITLSSDLGPYEPDQSFYIPFDVPDEEGTYQVSVYVDSEQVAKALFQVE